MPSTLPSELYKPIIDFLHGDFPLLRSLGLVCWEWNALSRSHLFSRVSLSQFGVDRDLQVICAGGSTIPQHVRELELNMKRRLEDPDSTNRIFENLPLLPAIRTLSLTRVSWKNITSPHGKGNLSRVLQSVTKLSLCQVNFESMYQAYDVINTARQLEVLELLAIRCDRYDPSGELKDLVIAPQLYQITTADSEQFTQSLFSKLCGGSDVSTIRNVSIEVCYDNVSSTCRFIASLGSSLETLFLGCVVRVGDALIKEIDLSQSSFLRSISFSVSCGIAGQTDTTSWITRLLSQKVSACPLKAVKLTVFVNSLDGIDTLQLPSMGALFSDKTHSLCRNSAIFSLILRINWTVDRSAVNAIIKERLAILYAEGRLDIDS
ncbi:hypothetical protein M422DRAFT_261194 [Sphaerobolus stellatus SS14]|uniref:F-box domain-containing protein n=1 Tax=Sphaerobolus stellatus (strain SS14) TaxID=990650 RepID=A0A0C9VFU3_SPHS4|nr:hypothetical protein M422DRAFT_261194 [Sphaerobolus stellatus SS14]